jgi:hypothetical protein
MYRPEICLHFFYYLLTTYFLTLTQCTVLITQSLPIYLDHSIILLSHHLALFTLPPQAPEGDEKIGIRRY